MDNATVNEVVLPFCSFFFRRKGFVVRDELSFRSCMALASVSNSGIIEIDLSCLLQHCCVFE